MNLLPDEQVRALADELWLKYRSTEYSVGDDCLGVVLYNPFVTAIASALRAESQSKREFAAEQVQELIANWFPFDAGSAAAIASAKDLIAELRAQEPAQ